MHLAARWRDATACCANGSGTSSIFTWKSSSDVVDRATATHMARQNGLNLKIKKITVLDLEFILEKC